MKTIKVKRLQEAISVNDPEVKRRISSLLRASKAAKEAATKAREQGKEPLADRLDKRGDELEELANSINIDTLDDGESETHGGKRQAGQGGGGKSGHEANGSEDSDDAEDAGEDNQGSDDDSNNDIENSEQSAGERASEAVGRANKAAEEAKQAAEEAKQAAKQQGTSEAQKAVEEAEQAAEEAAKAAERAQQHAKAAREAEANDNQAEAESEAEKAEDAAKEAEKAAENANDAADNASGKGQSGDNESEDDSDNSDDDSDASDNNGSKSNKGDKDNKQKGKGGDAGNNDSDENDSDDSDSKGSKSSKGGKSGKPSDNSDEDGDTDDMDLADDDEDDSEDPFKDPFADEEDIPQLNIGSPNGKEPREATIKDIIKQINKLEGEAKRGAIQGLKDLINSRKPKEESLKLTEAKKGVRDMTDDEFGDLINDTWEMIKEVETDVEEVDDLADKKAKINAWQNDKNAIAELNNEDTMDKKKERHKIKAREKEANKYSSFESLDDFIVDFEAAIKYQVDEVLADYQTYDEIDPETEGEDVIYKATVQRSELAQVLPIIDIYFDRSGSWNATHTAIGKRAIATVQKEYAEKGLCTLNIYYFDDYVTEDEHARFLGHGGTNAWPHILDNIKATEATNVMIMTDDDMNGDAYGGPSCVVDGIVWWIWKDGRQAPECVKHLTGREGNYQYSFRSR